MENERGSGRRGWKREGVGEVEADKGEGGRGWRK